MLQEDRKDLVLQNQGANKPSNMFQVSKYNQNKQNK